MNQFIGVIIYRDNIIEALTISALDEMDAGRQLAAYTYEQYNRHHDHPDGWYQATIIHPRLLTQEEIPCSTQVTNS